MINFRTFPLHSGFTWSNPQHLAADPLTHPQIAKQHVWVWPRHLFLLQTVCDGTLQTNMHENAVAGTLSGAAPPLKWRPT